MSSGCKCNGLCVLANLDKIKEGMQQSHSVFIYLQAASLHRRLGSSDDLARNVLKPFENIAVTEGTLAHRERILERKKRARAHTRKCTIKAHTTISLLSRVSLDRR